VEGKQGIGLRKVDIIIVNYNSTDYLLKCIHSIYDVLEKEIAASIYVVDNASEDNIGRLSQAFPQISLLKNKVNIGFARAVNYCLSRTSAPYIILLNPDTLVEKSFFTSIFKFMDENPKVGVAGPKILEKTGKVQGSARSFPTPMTALFGRDTFLSKFFPNNRMTSKNILTNQSGGQKNMKVDWVSGACMILRRSALKEVGLMDERFFLYWEDADLCKRMSEKGWFVAYSPDASIVHYAGVSSKKRIRPLLEFHKSAYYFFCKYSKSKNSSVVKAAAFTALCLRFYIILVTQCILRLKMNKQGVLAKYRNGSICK
jgi:hypothetical protein